MTAFGSGPLFLNTILLGGEGSALKLAAASAAGFAQIELWEEDVSAFDGGASALVAAIDALGLGLTDYQVLRDFDGAASTLRAASRDKARAMMDAAAALGALTIQAPSNTRDDVVRERIPEDLAWLAAEAASRGLKVAHEAMAWSKGSPDLPTLWANVLASGAANIDVVIDAFHLFAAGRTLADLDDIPASRIANVQLCDGAAPGPLEDVKSVGKHARLLPGDGVFPLHALADRLDAKGYGGPVGIEVFNDELKEGDPFVVAQRAMDSLRPFLSR